MSKLTELKKLKANREAVLFHCKGKVQNLAYQAPNYTVDATEEDMAKLVEDGKLEASVEHRAPFDGDITVYRFK